MYKHEVAPMCKNQTKCKIRLCPNRHYISCNLCDFVTNIPTDFDTHKQETHLVIRATESDEVLNHHCNQCEFETKSMVGLKIHTTAKHKTPEVITENVPNTVNDSEQTDEEDEDDDGPNECNHCFINGVIPGYVTMDWDDLLRHIWTDHKENTVWGPAH